MHESLHIRSHFELLLWLQGDIQKYIPHDVMIAAWGDFAIGVIYIDVVSALPGIRTGNVSSKSLIDLLLSLFNNWLTNSKKPFNMSVDKGLFHEHQILHVDTDTTLKKMKSALVHGIKDFRGGHDCLYIFISTSSKTPQQSRKFVANILPYIDFSLRQLEHLPEQLPGVAVIKEEPEDEIVGTLSSREVEIMEWVKGGKTNQDIGMILNISAFTVKNHMQRIFKKLDVLNRAQAVTKYNRMYQTQ